MKQILIVLCLATQVGMGQQATGVSLVPRPASMKMGSGSFRLRDGAVICYVAQSAATARYLADLLATQGVRTRLSKKRVPHAIQLRAATGGKPGSYSLLSSKDEIVISGTTDGLFYGVQTLLQLLPTKSVARKQTLLVPAVRIDDAPRFSYRGMHLDVSRHFFPATFIKRFIDYLAQHKMNTFHWHLTDDQGWRIEIKKYPLLISKGAFRNGTIIGRYPGTGNDNQRYGGFYTQREIRDIVKYAEQRHITVIPEIEMPGHSSAAIAAYPWLSCFPDRETVIPTHPSSGSQLVHGKKVQETWGVFEDVFCAGNDSTFGFLEDVLTEVMSLFPSRMIHVGGDECPKVNWKECPKCQARIRAEGLADEHALQSYFIQRIERFLNAAGRTLVGWDEILEGGLAPNAVVMSWRGEAGGIAAARQRHQVIMTPQKPVYFDQSQSKNEDSLVIGGFNPLESVYAYEPVPAELDSAQAGFILGAQANVWTEYMSSPKKVEYMIFPRLSALSEVLWSPKESRDRADFERRLPALFQRYDHQGTRYSTAFYDLKASLLPAAGGGLLWKLESREPTGLIKYTVDSAGREMLYNEPVPVRGSGRLSARLYMAGKPMSSVSATIRFSRSTGRAVTITAVPNEKYPGQGGAFSLVNGIYSNKGLSFPDWLGFVGDDLVATIDLGTRDTVRSVRMHTLDQNGSWVYLPAYVDVAVSDDGVNFRSVGRSSEFVKDTLTMGFVPVSFTAVGARYLRVTAKNYGLIPTGKPGAGNKAWLFADELIVE
ncbi:MAG: family 20 glycosylhydrolase [Flaviaesturariibacter sp.]|nr:family 20 glycosylhydrolase [Flaviaesturariibacter sp.]